MHVIYLLLNITAMMKFENVILKVIDNDNESLRISVLPIM